MEATFSLSRQLHPTPFHLSLARPNKPTFINSRTNVTFHRNPSFPSLTLRPLPTLKSHRQTHTVNCSQPSAQNALDGDKPQKPDDATCIELCVAYIEFHQLLKADQIEIGGLQDAVEKLIKYPELIAEELEKRYKAKERAIQSLVDIGLIWVPVLLHLGKFEKALEIIGELTKQRITPEGSMLDRFKYYEDAAKKRQKVREITVGPPEVTEDPRQT